MTRTLRSRRTLASAALPLAIAGLALAAPGAVGAPAAPNVAVSMTGPATLAAGEHGIWVITVTNAGPVSVPVSDIIVDNPLFDRYGLTPDSTPKGGMLAPGAMLTYTQRGRFGTEICGDKKSITNDATVRLAKGTESDLTDNAATATSRVLPCHTDLGLAKSADKSAYLPGETITWTVVATNLGSTYVHIPDVTVSDPMLAGMTADDLPADGWLAPGASVTYRGTSVATAEQCGQLTNTAAVSVGSGYGSDDVNAANDSASATVTIAGGACEPVVPVSPQPRVLPATSPAIICPATRLGVALSAPRSAVAGQIMRVKVTGRNAGRGTAKGAVLRYRVPSGASLVGRPANASLSGGVLTVRLGDLVSGGVRRLGVTLTLDRTAGGRTHRASMTAACAVAATRQLSTRVAALQGPAQPAVTG